MVVLDSTIVNVALPAIGKDLKSTHGLEWVVTAYLVAVCVAQPAAGWLADRFGRKPIYQLSLLAFTGASLAAALAPNLGVLIACRALQGAGGGALGPVGMTIVFDIFPRSEHGRAVGIWGLAAIGAPAIGPTVGGWLVTSVSWHWLFLINLPIGVIATVLGVRLLPDMPLRSTRRFDTIGFLTGGVGLALAVLGLSEGNTWGWGSTKTLVVLALGLGLLAVFVLHELRVPAPLLQLRMFANPVFALMFLISFLVTSSQFARLVFIPLSLETLRDFTAFRVGLLLLPAALVMAVGMTLGGRMADRVGSRPPILIGIAIMIPAVFMLSRLTLHTPVWQIDVLISAQGFGMGLTAPPTVVAAMATVPSELLAQGSALRAVFQQFSGAVAVAGFATVYSLGSGLNPGPGHAQDAYNTIFFVSACTLVVALLLALRLPAGKRSSAKPVDPAATAHIGD
jgi:EmrB/QacA subfamily drug resistance transporter